MDDSNPSGGRSAPTTDGSPARPAGGRRGVSAPPSRGDRQLALGRSGEDLAVIFLEERGMSILERNFRCPRGEIDIIARDGDELVFVEVKTRRSLALGSPLEAITPAKLARLRMLAAVWLAQQTDYFPAIRIDGLGIVTGPVPQYFHAENLQAM